MTPSTTELAVSGITSVWGSTNSRFAASILAWSSATSSGENGRVVASGVASGGAGISSPKTYATTALKASSLVCR